MPKFLVSYELPYVHRVTIGIEADSAEQAKGEAEFCFDQGTAWDDTPDMPLIYDDYEESDTGNCLTFKAEPVDEFPEKAPIVRYFQARETALAACRALVAAYKKGGESESVDWDDVDAAHEMALKAVGGRTNGL